MVTIALPETLMVRTEAVAQRKGLKVDDLVVMAVQHYLDEEEQVSPARRRLRELLASQKKKDDFMEAVHRAKEEALKLIEGNQDWIDLVMAGGADHKWKVEDESLS